MTPLETLKRLRPAYSTPMSKDQLGAYLNAVAWTHRADGYGLLKKPTGSNCRQPQTGTLISSDILCKVEGKNLLLWDVLIGSGEKAVPTWGAKKSLQDLSRWVAPVDASVALPPDPGPTGGTMPAGKPYPGDAFGAAIGNRLFADYAAAHQVPNAGVGIWILRTCWDVANPPYLTPEQSLEKHQKSWREILGLT